LETLALRLFRRFRAADCLDLRCDVREWRRRILPDLVTLNLFAAVFLVLSLGISKNSKYQITNPK
jgi:hypothetical protein